MTSSSYRSCDRSTKEGTKAEIQQTDSPEEIAAFLDHFDRGGNFIEFGGAVTGGRVERAHRALATCQTHEQRRRFLRQWPGFARFYCMALRAIDEAMIEGTARRIPPES